MHDAHDVPTLSNNYCLLEGGKGVDPRAASLLIASRLRQYREDRFDEVKENRTAVALIGRLTCFKSSAKSMLQLFWWVETLPTSVSVRKPFIPI